MPYTEALSVLKSIREGGLTRGEDILVRYYTPEIRPRGLIREPLLLWSAVALPPLLRSQPFEQTQFTPEPARSSPVRHTPQKQPGCRDTVSPFHSLLRSLPYV